MVSGALVGNGYRVIVSTDHGEIETDVVDTDDGALVDLNFEAKFENADALAAQWQKYIHDSCPCPPCTMRQMMGVQQ